ncbi:CAP domain-containing protein [Marmoricola sp. RAF53]|uniref:CAP domain-containing protein n=1 Tax=Marmoricola sp. RAF53 TaxID=3233059 RepID=UPI003F9E6425
MWENRTFPAANRKFTGLTAVAAVVATALLCAVVPSAPASAREAGPAAGTRVTQRWQGAVNTRSMAAVNAAYWAGYAPKYSLPIDWLGGSILGCLPGLSSAGSNAATLSALNYVRSLAGLAPVVFSPGLNAGAQRAALMMDANDRLDHNPGRGWRCWSSVGATAASRSNLALAWPELRSGQIIGMYMDDRGGSNTAVGHRRWILNPFSTVMGSGSTSTANALTVIGPTSRNRPNPRYVSWPTAGYFPTTLEPAGRWSLSAGLGNVDFRRARVAVYRNGARVPATKYGVHNGYAQPTLVFQLGAGVPKSGNFRVVVSNIKRPGARPSRYVYGVNLFTPYH